MTNIELITDALRLINVISEVETPSAEQADAALRAMNQMLAEWTESDIDFGYFPQTSLAEESPVPSYAERGVIAMLAVELAPKFGTSVSMELASRAMSGYESILRRAIKEKMTPQNMDHLPIGQGHHGNIWDIDTGY